MTFTSAVTNHDDSDNCGVDILGDENEGFWKDHKGAKVNAIRTRTLLERADVVVVRFGDKYRQWNAAFDAGFAAALADAHDWTAVGARRTAMEARLKAAGAIIHGDGAPRLPNISSIGLPGVAAATQVMMLDLETEVEMKLPGRFKVSPQIAGAIKAVAGVVDVQQL